MLADLAQYRWQNRLLVTFAPSEAAASKQARLLDLDPVGRRDRQLLRIVVMPDSATVEDKPAGLDPASLRRKYRIGRNEFRFLLVGKDGTVAYSSRRPVSLASIFARIDVMPMRRDEVRRRGS